MVLIALIIGTWLVLSKKSSPRRKTIGKWLLISTIAFLGFIGISGNFWLDMLKKNYPAFTFPSGIDPNAEYVIAVAGNAFIPDEKLPAECRFNDSMLLRLWEAGRIARMMESQKRRYRLVISLQDYTPAEKRLAALHSYFALFGIAAERVTLQDGTLNSQAEVKAFSRHPGKIILVSEAYHMPRLMRLARKYGLEAIPAPVGIPASGNRYRFFILDLIPSAENFNDFRIFTYELLGMLEVCLF